MKLYKQFYMFKFDSSRIHKTNYNFKLTFKQAQKNDEIVAMGDNQLFRTIRQIKKRSFDPTNKISMFMPEVISINVEHTAHYKNLIKDGILINNILFKRFLCGAGHARNNTVYFIEDSIFDIINEIFKNDHGDLEMNPAKYNAYFGLYASVSKIVSTPNVCVVKDFKYNAVKKVDWIEGDVVTVIDKELEFNAFDGQGLISPRMSSTWANDLHIKYTPSQFIIRAPFIKGMLATFDFHQFAYENHIDTITDLWGDIYNIQDIDVILSESQFKLWSAYKNWKSYVHSTNKNNLSWGVTRANPKKDKDVAFTNYQYIQTLKLSNKDIKNLCQPTIDWLRGVATDEDPLQALLFLIGEKYDDIFEIMSAKDIDIGKGVVLNNELLKHPYVKNKIHYMIEKKMNDACMGKLAVQGNYQMMIADPYAQAQHALKLPVTGLLKENEYYSNYWLKQGITQVDACRSPMTHYSEHNILNFKKNGETQFYFGHLDSGIVINIWGDDCMRFADADFDGDILMTTNNEYFIKGVEDNLLPITYSKQSAPKEKICFDSCVKADFSSFDTKIGVITNYSTSLYSLEAKHANNKEKLEEIQTRIKILRREQGNQIDKAKGVQITGFPTHWVKWSKVDIEKDTPEEIESKNFNNDIIIEKKPYFMTYVYPALKKELKEWLKNMDTYSKKVFGCSVDELVIKNEKTEDEIKFLKNYERYVPVDLTSCVMNKLSFIMEKEVINLKKWKAKKEDVDWILLDKNIKIDESKLVKVKRLYKEYQVDKKNKKELEQAFHHEDFMSNGLEKEELIEKMLKVVSDEELVNYCVHLDNKSFVWEAKLDNLINIIFNNRQKEVWIPIEDENGEYQYLNKRYTKKGCELW